MRSIRRQLTVRLLVGTLAVALGAELGLFLYLRDELAEQLDVALLAKARALGSMVQVSPDGTLDFELSERAMPEFAQAEHPEYFQVWRADGSVFQRSESLAGGDLPLPPPEPGGHRKRFFDMPAADGRVVRAVATRVRPTPDADAWVPDTPAAAIAPPASPAGAEPPPLTIMLAMDREELDETVAHMGWGLLAIAGGIAGGVTLVVTAVVRRGLAPLRELGEAAARIDSETLAYRFRTDDVPEELKPICLRLNDLLARMEETLVRARRFTADVAHELRTPLAELRLLAEVVLKWPMADAEASARNYGDVLAIARRMEGVVASLLSLVRCQSVDASCNLVTLDLRDVVADAWRGHSSEAGRRALTVDVDVPDGLAVRGDRGMLGSMFGNLFGNAVAYAPAGGRVTCVARAERAPADESRVVLTLENDNPGLGEDDLAHLWEPFWRKDAARSDAEHCGLGLALVKAYVRAMSIGLAVELTRSKKFRITVSFPDTRDDPAARRTTTELSRQDGTGAAAQATLLASASGRAAEPAAVASASGPAARV
jgi:two-component system sensor histidine kinase QseC